MTFQAIGKHIIQLEKVQSTNDYALNLVSDNPPDEGLIVLARQQTSGKGQAGNAWESESGKNLTLSIILKPDFLEPSEQFYLSKIIALSIRDLVNEFVQNVRIKWPNDIYVNNDKIAGILIENSFTGNRFEYSVIGTGLNVNQKSFPENIYNPTSLLRETGSEYKLNEILQKLIQHFNYYYKLLFNQNYSEINKNYLSHIYRFNEIHSFKTANRIIKGRITGIRESGQLEITCVSGKLSYYGFKEIEFLQAPDSQGKS